MPRRDPTRAAERPEGRQADATVVLAPRRFLVGLAVVVLLPWMALAFLYLRGWGRAPTGGPPAEPGAPARGAAQTSGPRRGAVGPWGQIETTPIVISPPLEYIPDDPDPPRRQAEWFFALRTPGELTEPLESVGVDPSTRQRILAAPREPRDGGLVVHPDAEMVRATRWPSTGDAEGGAPTSVPSSSPSPRGAGRSM